MKLLPSLISIDDDIHFAKLVELYSKDIVSFSWVNTISKARQYLKLRTFDIILLDLYLEKENGATFIKEMVDEGIVTSSSRIILLTASDKEADFINANCTNISETIQKPISENLFKSILKKHIRQLYQYQQGELIVGKIRLLPEKQIVLLEETDQFKIINLSKIEFLIIYTLAKNPNIVLSRSRLLEELPRSLENSERVIDVHISSIRSAHPSFKQLIKTQRGNGYVLTI